MTGVHVFSTAAMTLLAPTRPSAPGPEPLFASTSPQRMRPDRAAAGRGAGLVVGVEDRRRAPPRLRAAGRPVAATLRRAPGQPADARHACARGDDLVGGALLTRDADRAAAVRSHVGGHLGQARGRVAEGGAAAGRSVRWRAGKGAGRRAAGSWPEARTAAARASGAPGSARSARSAEARRVGPSRGEGSAGGVAEG